MKTILTYDFETQTLPLFSMPSEHPDQPHFTQIAAELCIEETGETLASINLLVRPDGWVISQEVQDLTGITMAKAERYGIPEETALNAFLEMWCNADTRVAHNESFDARIARIAIMRSAYWSGEQMQTSEGDVSFAD